VTLSLTVSWITAYNHLISLLTSGETYSDSPKQLTGKHTFMKKLTPLIIIAGIVLLGYNFLTKNKAPNNETTTNQTTLNAPKQNNNDNSAVIKKAEPLQEVRSTLGTIVTTLGSITDVKSAKAAVPALKQATQQLGDFTSKLDQIPKSELPAISSVVSATIPRIKAIINKLDAIPGVGEVLQPVIKDLVEQLGAIIKKTANI